MYASALLATIAIAAITAPASALTAANITSSLDTVAPDGTGRGCFLQPNTDREGSDLSSKRGPLDSCYATCAATNGCRTFTWSNYNGGTCWLKSSGSRPIEKAGVTGYTCLIDANSPPPADPGCYYNAGDRLGFDLTNVRGPINSCYGHCKATDNCITFTWSDYQGGTCWLKSYGSRPVSKPGVIGYTCLFNRPTNVCTQYKDIDFVGMDIGSVRGGAVGCCTYCNDFPGCTAYAWTDYQGGTCWFKKSVGQAEYKPGVISSSLLPLYGGVCAAEYNTDFVGNDIGNKPSADAGVCCGQCKATAGCKAYTWTNYNGGTCWMKNGKGATAVKTGATSATIAIF